MKQGHSAVQMHKKHRGAALLAAAILILSLSGALTLYYQYGYGSQWQKLFGAGAVSLAAGAVELEPGETRELEVSVTPFYANKHSVLWTSSNPEVVRVERGKAKALREGTATITAAGKRASAQVAVTVKLREGSLMLRESALRLNTGEKTGLHAGRFPKGEAISGVQYQSTDRAVANVDETGTVTAGKPGTAEIIASAEGKEARCQVEVITPPTHVVLRQGTARLSVGQTVDLPFSIGPAGASPKGIIWSTSDATVAEVHDGTLLAVGAGGCTVTAAAGTVTSVCKVTVLKTDIVVKLSESRLTLAPGEAGQLDLTIMTPPNTVKNAPVYQSSDRSVVQVGQTGKLLAKQSGTAIITVKTDVGDAYCKVIVQ